MNRAEALEHFEHNYVRPKVLEKLLQAEAYLIQHREELAAQYLDSLRHIGTRIAMQQSTGRLDKVGFINYSMLRSALIAQKPQYRIDVYNKEWYFDSTQLECQGEYDASPIFRYLDELESELETPRRRYLNQISPADLELIKRREAAKFNQLVMNLAGYALNRTELVKELTTVDREAEFEIRVGEYYDRSEVVYKEDRRVKDAAENKEWLEDKQANQYVAAVLRTLDLSGGNYAGNNLSRVDLRGSNLTNCNLENSNLIKARLNDCILKQASFRAAAIHDADFSGADLQQAIFFAADGPQGLAATLATEIYSVWGVNFAGANLEDADFRYANLAGANFKGAHLLNTNFQGARLNQAVFLKSDLAKLQLNEGQIQSINWVD